MKKCRDIENLLPLYPDGALADAEKRAVEEHLASCAICRKELAYLNKAHQLVTEIPEVEEPPWFRQKILAQVRKEAEKNRFAQKWFYPLRIRIPLQIMASIIIAVLAVYIYRSGENSMKQILPGVQPPAVEMQKEDAKPAPQKVPHMSAPAVLSPKSVLREETGLDKGTRREAAGDGDVQQSAVPESKTQPLDSMGTGNAQISAEKKAEKSFAIPRHSGEQISAKTDAAPSVQVAPQEQKVVKAETSEREAKTEDRGFFNAANKKDSKKAAAPTAPQSMAASVDAGMQPVSVTLFVGDVNMAAADVEKMLAAYDAKIPSRQMDAQKTVLQITLPAKYGKTVLSKLKDIGQVHEKTHLSEIKDQNIMIILEIVQF